MPRTDYCKEIPFNPMAQQPTNSQIRERYGGAMGKLYADEMKISRGEQSRNYILNGDQPFGLYAQVKLGDWLHRNLNLDRKSTLDVLLEAISQYMNHGKVKFNRRESTLEHSAAIPVEERRCMLSVKENGVHIMITVKRDSGRAWEVKDICGKQGPFDDVNARTGAFKSVCYALLHNASFDFLPAEEDCVLLQAELVVPRTFMRLTNHHDVTSLIFSYGRSGSDQEKHEILNKLELRFFNVGGLRIDPVDRSTTYVRYDLDKVSSILAQLVKTEYSPQYAKGTTRKLRVCSSLYFDKKDISDDWDTCVVNIAEFVTRYRNQEGFIFRAEGCQWVKYKRVYTDKLGAATRVPGSVVPVLIGPSGNLDTIEGVVVAPPLKHGGTECKELLTIDFGIEHDPDGETGVYYTGGAKWSGLDYLRNVLSRGQIVQHSQTAHEHRCTYRVAMPDGRELVYHCRNLGKLGHRVAFVCIGEGVDPCFCLKFNELITNSDRDVMLDTSVLMSLVVPGGRNRDLENKSLAELIEIMTPPHDHHIHRELTTQTKIFFNSLIPGLLQRRSDYAHDLPWDLSKQDAFLSGIVSCYEDFQEGKVTDVPLTKRYLLAAKHHREGGASAAQPFVGYQFPHPKGQAPRIRFHRPTEISQAPSSPIDTPPPAARAMPAPTAKAIPEQTAKAMPEQTARAMPEQTAKAMPEQTARATPGPVTFTIMKTPDSCSPYKNTAWDNLKALQKAGRHFEISSMTIEQLFKLFEATLDRRSTTKGKESWNTAMNFLQRHVSLLPAQKAFLTRQVDVLIDLIKSQEAKELLFDENGRERDTVVQCTRVPIPEGEWTETARRAEAVQIACQIDLTSDSEQTTTTTPAPVERAVKRARQPPPQSTRPTVSAMKLLASFMQDDQYLHVMQDDEDLHVMQDDEDLHVGGGTPPKSRYA